MGDVRHLVREHARDLPQIEPREQSRGEGDGGIIVAAHAEGVDDGCVDEVEPRHARQASARGEPLDGRGAIRARGDWPLSGRPLPPLDRAEVVEFFLRQRAGTLKAAANPEALRAEITGFVASGMDKVELVEKLSALAQGGGLRFIPRLQAAWSISQLPSDVIAHLDEQEHLRWFVPPQISATWMWTVTTFWTGFGCVCLISVLGALSATSVL